MRDINTLYVCMYVCMYVCIVVTHAMLRRLTSRRCIIIIIIIIISPATEHTSQTDYLRIRCFRAKKQSGVIRMQENFQISGATSRTPLGDLTALPETYSWWAGDSWH